MQTGIMPYQMLNLLVVVVLVCAFFFVRSLRKQQLLKRLLERYNSQIDMFFAHLETLKSQYIAYSDYEEIQKTFGEVYKILQQSSVISRDSKLQQFATTFRNLDKLIPEWNKEYVVRELVAHQAFLSDIDGKNLDRQQREAVVVNEDNNLVIAGAGSGKTLTIAGKVAYLVKKKGIDPTKILLITFTNKAAEEMEDRIVHKLNIPVKVTTFHALGNSILTTYNNKRSSIEDNSDHVLLKYFSTEIVKDPMAMKQLVIYFAQYLHPLHDKEEFENLGQFANAHKHVDLETLRSISKSRNKTKTTFAGEKVKSIQELLIANYLFLNGINYEYEKNYKYRTVNSEHRQYRPDFYLSDYGIYIEHFGVNKKNKAPYLSNEEEKNYIRSMEWKKNLHKQHRTKLIETYSYQFAEENSFIILEQQLKKLGVIARPITEERLRECFSAIQFQRSYRGLINLISTFLNLFKSNCYHLDDIDKLDVSLGKASTYDIARKRHFLILFKSIYSYYQKHLSDNDRIDFNDMINDAASLIRTDAVKLNYQHIIIDEYQDISVARYRLINALKEKTGAKLMAVGDDWQSIYRFAGSDINLFTSFEQLFGKSKILRIEKTYRNSQELLNLARDFIVKNPLQVPKKLWSDKKLDRPVSVITYESRLDIALLAALQKIASTSTSTNIMLLGRNNHDIEDIVAHKIFKRVKNNDGVQVITHDDFPNFSIRFLTVHKAKGLEADEVIIINGKNALQGFPNQISDDPVLDMVLTKGDAYMYGEERRLFYVALTRTKNRCILLSPAEQKRSVFIQELIDNFQVLCDEAEPKSSNIAEQKCPVCKTGILAKRYSKDNHSFLGCSNYPFCRYSALDDTKTDILCTKCGSVLVKMNSVNGNFLGCSNYSCRKVMQAIPKNQARVSNAKDAVDYLDCGNAYAEKGQYDQAIANYTQAIDLDFEYAEAYYKRGNAYRKKGQNDQAINDYNQAIDLDPTDNRVYNNRGNAYNEKGQYDLAIADYSQSMALDPKLSNPYYNRGNVYNEKGQYDLAIADFNQAIALDPTYANAYYNKALVNERIGRLREAIEDYRQVITCDPNQYSQRTEYAKKRIIALGGAKEETERRAINVKAEQEEKEIIERKRKELLDKEKAYLKFLEMQDEKRKKEWEFTQARKEAELKATHDKRERELLKTELEKELEIAEKKYQENHAVNIKAGDNWAEANIRNIRFNEIKKLRQQLEKLGREESE